jgi:mannitol-1-phosphate/altronate dehydrogenase
MPYEENNNNNSSMLEDVSKLNERVYNLSKGSSLSSSPSSSSSTYDALNDSRRSSIASITTGSGYFNDSNNNSANNHVFHDLNKQKLMQHLSEQNQFKPQPQQQQTIRKTKINFSDISDLIN